MQAIAQQEGDSYAMVLQAHSLSEYPDLYRGCSSAAICPYPTMQQMLAMRDAVLAHPTPRLILWYSDFDLQHSGDYERHRSDLVAAVNQGRPQPAPSASATVVGTAASRAASRPAELGVQPARRDPGAAQAMAAVLQAVLFAVLLCAICATRLVVSRRARQ